MFKISCGERFTLMRMDKSGTFVEDVKFKSVDDMVAYFATTSRSGRDVLFRKRCVPINQMNLTGSDVMSIAKTDIGSRFYTVDKVEYVLRPLMLVDGDGRTIDVRNYMSEIVAAIAEERRIVDMCVVDENDDGNDKSFRRVPVPYTGRRHYKGSRSTVSLHHDMVAETIPEYEEFGRRSSTARRVSHIHHGVASRSWKECRKRHQWE